MKLVTTWLNKNRTLRQQLQFWGSFLTITTAFLLIIVMTTIEIYQITHEKRIELVNSLNRQENFADLWLEERTHDIESLSKLNAIQNFKIEEIASYFDEFLNTNYIYDDFVLINADGFVVLDTQGNRIEDQIFVSTRSYFKKAMKKEQSITDITTSRVTGEQIIIIASPILSKENEFKGVLFGTISSEKLSKVMSYQRGNTFEHTYIINSDYQYISGPLQEGNHQKKIDEETLELILNISGQKPQLAFEKWYSPIFLTSSFIDGMDWLVVSEVQIVDVLRPLFGKLFFIFIAIFISFLLSSWIMVYMSKKIEQPIQAMFGMVKKVENGEFNAPIHQEKLQSNIYEFEKLYESFSEMSSNIMDNVNKLEKKSHTCSLTQLNNRYALMEQGQIMLDTARIQQVSCCCLILDVDHFKNVNDTYGHIIGDKILKHIAKILKQTVRSSDIVARFGGEEFIILTYQMNKQQGKQLAERIRQAIFETPYIDEDTKQTISVTVSIGIVHYVPKNEEEILCLNDLIESADKALYIAKNNGRNQVVVANVGNN